MKKVIENIPAEPFCEKLRGLREMLGYKTPKAFANDVGVNYTTYLNYEKNRLPPSEFLFLIKRKFGRAISLDQFFEDAKNRSNDFEQISEPAIRYSVGKHEKLINMTVEILDSNSDYSKHLVTTINLCHEAMKMKKNIAIPFEKSTERGVM